ncbi:restriction endonuclease subunit S [Methylovulum miyakonense]|uniref:restriction endonuclease subunit S n=1 Tax=Methylovulum miyakonense TaxID=645578 RepID=UPI00036095B0|nr:restriction endonuclease subunit S [Methylovulum miyakonense]
MDAQRFLAEFGHIANAPGGVSQLRALILNLAVSGKLVPQQLGESSNSFIEKVERERAKQIQLGAFKKNKKLLEDVINPPWQIPSSWKWVRLAELCSFSAGRTPSRKEGKYWNTGNYPWFSIADLVHGAVIHHSSESISQVARDEVFKSAPVEAGTLLMSFKLSIGKLSVLGVDAYHNEAIIAIYPFATILKDYFFKCLNGFDLNAGNKAAIKGNTLNQDSISNILVALPPEEEIPRIVAKVDELMALCDQMEAQQKDQQTLRSLTRTTVFRSLSEAQSPKELSDAWLRVQREATELLDSPESITSYKGAILDLAMSGQLLKPQDKASTTGKALLETILSARIAWSKKVEGQEQKETQTMLKKIRTQKLNLPESTLPEHWTWGSFLQIAQAVVDCHNKTAPYVSNGIHLIRTTDIRNGRMDLKNTRKISEETYAFWSRRMPPKSGDVFFTREAPMGEAAIVPEGDKVCLGQRTMLVRLFPEYFNNQFLLYAIQSPSFQLRMVEGAIGMTVKHLRVGGVEDLLVPVPPKSEQDRIVELIDQLFERCDQLAMQLEKKLTLASNLAKAGVEAITGIRNEEEEEALKPPKTELIAKLRLANSPNNKEQAPLAAILARHQGEMSAGDLWQRYGGEIDAFYAQLKQEVGKGWIAEPAIAEMRETEAG